MKKEQRYTRAIYAFEMAKPCPYCDLPIERDDLIVEEEIHTDKKRKHKELNFNTGKPRTVSKPVVKMIYSHKTCWLAAHNQEDWYRPGIMAEDPEENPRRTIMKRRYNPDKAGENINISYGSPGPHPVVTENQGASETPHKSVSALGIGLIVLTLAAAAFASWYFFIKTKWKKGDVLIYAGATTPTYTIQSIGWPGGVHSYMMVLSTDTTTPIAYAVSGAGGVDSDTNWTLATPAS
jgi:hypothetical protein